MQKDPDKSYGLENTRVYDEIVQQRWGRQSTQDGNIPSLVMTVL